MQSKPSSSQKIYLSVLALLGWFAVIGQFYIIIASKAAPLGELIVRFFGYFTITTNILVAVCCTVIVAAATLGPGNFFYRQSTLAAIAVYIVVVGLTYNTLLRFLWKPQGLQWVVDELLHSVIPVMYLLYWLVAVPKDQLQWKYVWPWLIYPLIYTIFMFIRGALSGFYPYPFIDIGKIGLTRGTINTIGLAGLFAFLSLLFIGIGKLNNKRQ